MSGKDSFHPFDLLSKVTPMCLIQLLPIIYYFEYPLIEQNIDEIPTQTWCAVLMTGFMALCLNIANFFTNRLVAPLTVTIAGKCHEVSNRQKRETFIIFFHYFNVKYRKHQTSYYHNDIYHDFQYFGVNDERIWNFRDFNWRNILFICN